MSPSNSGNIQLCYIFLTICKDKDIQKLIKLIYPALLNEEFSSINNNLQNRENFIKNINAEKLSNNQKLLILTYSHLYFAIYENHSKNSDLLFLLREFNINEIFTDTFNEIFKKEVFYNLIDNRSPIENIFEPTEKTLQYVTNFIYYIFQQGIFFEKQFLYGLNNREYEHELDRKALIALKDTPGLEKLTRIFNKYGLERFFKIHYTGSNIKVTNKNFPMLHKMLLKACSILALEKIPELYIQLGFINAMTMGVEEPIIVLTSGCIGLLTYDELLFILGHELGHIKSQHVLYHQMSLFFPYLGELISKATLGVGGLVSSGVTIALNNWYRKSEFTADRAGLLACQNINAAISALMKLAGLPPTYYKIANTEDFVMQAKEFEDYDLNKFDKVAKFLSIMDNTHPWTVMRAAELKKWIDSDNYTNILVRHDKKKSKLANSFCINCGKELQIDIQYCTNCGNALTRLRKLNEK
jgi:Zn-dependent protease with chaperone function